MIRWLHISDLHLGSAGMTTSMLRDELPVFLKQEGLKCDYVFCTGDIKTAGRADCGFSNEMADYIRKICDAVEVDTQMLFIVPGIIKGYSYSMTPFIMAENPELSASEAINRSKAMMDGHKTELFVLDLTLFGWAILCALTLNLGNLFLNPYRNAAYAAFYRQISGQRRYYEM